MKYQKLLTILFWLAIIGVSIFLYQREFDKSIVVYDNNKIDFKEFLNDKLGFIKNKAITKDSQIVKVLQLNDSLGNERTELWVAIDSLDTEKINPLNIWKPILEGQNAMIVNSPNENFNSYGKQTDAIVSKICRGCYLRELDEIKKKEPGEVHFTHCEDSGTYKQKGLFSWVANAIVINKEYYDQFSKSTTDSVYSDKSIADLIWKDNAAQAVHNLFNNYNNYFRNIPNRPQAMLFTNIGTHNGKVPISFVYERFFNELDSAIKKGDLLPKKIYLGLYPPHIEGNSEYDALYSGFKFLYNDFSRVQTKKYEKDWLEIIGISIGILILILLIPEIGRLVFKSPASYFAMFINNSSYEESGKANPQDGITNPHIIKSLL